MTRRFPVAFAAALGVLPSLPVLASAQGAQPLSDQSASASTPALAVAPDGSAVAVWQRFESVNGAGVTRIATAYRNARGVWSRERIISEPGDGQSSDQAPPDVAMTAAGAVAVWTQQALHQTDSTYAAVMRPGGRWSRPRRLGAGDWPAVAMYHGEALAVWVRPSGSSTHPPDSIEARWLRGGRWGPLQVRANLGAVDRVWAALDGERKGAVLALAVNARDRSVVNAFALNHGRFAAPRPLTRTGDSGVGSAALCTAPGRPVTAVWMEDTATQTAVVTASLGKRGWGKRTTLATQGAFPSCAADAAGNVVAGWVGHADARAAAGLRPVGGSWQRPVLLSDPGQSAVRIAVGLGAGIASAAWLEAPVGSAENHVAQAVRPRSGPWTSPATLSSGSAETTVAAADSRGRTVTVWVQDGVVAAS